MKFDTVTPVHQDPPVTQPAPKWFYGWTTLPTVYPPGFPQGGQRVVPDPNTSEWKRTPSYETSFKKVKQQRLIKMTPYSVGKSEVKYFVVSVPRFKSSFDQHVCMNVVNGEKLLEVMPIIDLHTRYLERYSMSSLPPRENESSGDWPVYEQVIMPTDEEIRAAINEVQSNVVNDSFSGFDALTNLAEFPETLGLILTGLKNARHPLKGIAELREKYEKARKRGKTHTEAHKEIMSQWMQYRYGIMPIILSIQDAIKLLDEQVHEFKTDHSTVQLVSRNPLFGDSPPSGNHLVVTGNAVVTVRATAKARYSSKDLRLRDLLTFNPLLTAWELVPLSFVIDWFVNVGDTLFANTAAMGDLAETRGFCYSVRTKLTRSTMMRAKIINGAYRNVDYLHVFNADFTYHQKWTKDNREVLEVFEPLKLEVVDSYERNLFIPSDVHLAWNPSLSWRRMLDAHALSFKTITKALKKLQ